MKPGQQGEQHAHNRDANRGPRERRATGDATAAAAETARALERLRAVDAVAVARDAITQRRMVKAAEVLMVVVVLMLGFSVFMSYAQAETLEQVTTKAMKGDYQAQRNLAYGYSSYPYKGQDKNQMLACAWRWVVLKSGNPRIDQTDVNNADVDCGKLDHAQQTMALAQSRTIFRSVYGRDPK